MAGVVVVLVILGWIPSWVSAGREGACQGSVLKPSEFMRWLDFRTGPARGTRKPEEPGDWKAREAVLPFGRGGDEAQAGAAGARSFDEIVTPIVEPRDWRPGERPGDQGSSYRVSAAAAANRERQPLAFLQRSLGRADFVPFDRLEQFAWCDGPGTAIVGWTGSIEETRDAPGGWRVRVRVAPKLARTSSNITTTGDSRVETYFVDDRGRRIYLGGAAGANAGRSIFGF